MTRGLSRMATVDAKTQRSTMSGGKRSDPTDNLTGLKIVPLAPVRPETARRMEIDTPYSTLVTFWIGEDGNDDVEKGDKLVITSSGDTYDIEAVAPWTDFQGEKWVQVFIQEPKR